ncbi:MAG: hypothetical protein DHS20C10_09240 [marine bacterium B5-7]|nr:MAG: hypothetical protein DHS20C10_09240 [marine bacterium B5-7]
MSKKISSTHEKPSRLQRLLARVKRAAQTLKNNTRKTFGFSRKNLATTKNQDIAPSAKRSLSKILQNNKSITQEANMRDAEGNLLKPETPFSSQLKK